MNDIQPPSAAPSPDLAGWPESDRDFARRTAALLPMNKTALFDALAAAGIEIVTVVFDGYGDSGQIEHVEAKPEFDRFRKAAPFRANDDMLALEPVIVLTLANSLDPVRAGPHQPFGPALNAGQKAEQIGLRHLAITQRRTG